jgi:hypothetical protein
MYDPADYRNRAEETLKGNISYALVLLLCNWKNPRESMEIDPMTF